jgi:uncharacterized protein (TIRG00374 family)
MAKQRMIFHVKKVLFLVLFLVCLGAVVLALLSHEDLYGMLRALRDADYRFVLLALFTYVFSTVLWSIRWQISLLAVGCTARLRDLYLVIYGSIFINNITPMMRAGGDPFGRMYLLRKIRGVPYSSSLATIMGEHALGTPVFFSFLALGLLMYFKAPLLLMTSVLVGIWVITVIMMLFFLRFFGRKKAIKWIGRAATRVLKLLRRSGSKTEVVKGIESFYKGAYKIIRRWKSALLIIALSAVLWIFDLIRLFLIFKALGCSAPLSMLLLASTFPTIAGLIPLLPGGLGLVDATFISIFRLFFPLNIAIAATVIERAISFVFSTFAGAGALSYLGIRLWSKKIKETCHS